MKKSFCPVLIVFIAALFPINAFSLETKDYLFGDRDVSAELSEIKADLNAEDEEIWWIIDDLDFEAAYKLYSFKEDDIISAYRSSQSVETMISGEYRWQIPTTDGKLATVMRSKETEKWKIIGYAEPSSPSSAAEDDTINKDVLADLIDEQIGEITELKYLNSFDYYTTFVCVKTETDEYFIPYCARIDFTGLENRKVYKLAEIMDTLEKNMGFPYAENNDSTGGGTDAPRSEYATIIIYSAIGVVVLAGLIIILHRYKKRKKQL